jgi:hypothetical protein
MLIPHAPLLACEDFTESLPAGDVASALARGLIAGGATAPDELLLEGPPAAAEPARELDALDFDVRMRAARAVVIAVPWLAERTLAGSRAFEIATRARQAGVPAYAIAAESTLNEFDARILDLQTILIAADRRALARAGRKLAATL